MRTRQSSSPTRRASIIPHCKVPGVSVKIDGQSVSLDMGFTVFYKLDVIKKVKVEFVGNNKQETQDVTIEAGETKDVTCALQ